MPDTQFYTNEAAFAKAAKIQTSLATSKMRFFDSALLPSPTVFTTRAQLIAAECTFDGYTAGGYPITAFTGPANTPGGGATLTSPVVNAAYGPAGTPPVTNAVGGWWIDDDGTPTPNVRLLGTFDPVRPMGTVGDMISIVVQIIEGRNPPPSG